MTAQDRKDFFRMFGYVKPRALMYAIGTFLYCVQDFLFPLVNALFFGWVTTAVLVSNISGVWDAVINMFIMMGGIAVLIGGGVYMYVVCITHAQRDVSMDVFRAFIKTSTESQQHSGEGVAALNADVRTATNIIDDGLTPFLQNLIGASFSIVAVTIIDWRMGLGALAIGLVSLLAQSRFAAPLARLGKAELETNAEAVKSVSNIFAGALTIRAFNRQNRSLIQFDKDSGKLKQIAFKQAFIGMWQDLFNTVQGWLSIVLVFALGGWLAIAGEMDFAQIIMVLPLAGAITRNMSLIGTSYAALQPPVVAARRLYNIIDSAAASPAGATPLKDVGGLQSRLEAGYGIEIKNLSFAYKDATEKALKDISLSVGENKMVAFVGESGSGKSTLLRAIIGMYERDELNMEIGGMAFSANSINAWRNRFAYVDQSCKLFDMSISENIAMGTQGKATDTDIQEAAKRAFAHDFINELPEAYAASCGEKGASLSGGQKQRIAIARALVRKAPILVFDEATAALDAVSEHNIMETIQNLRQDHTVLITTHNLANIATADTIVVLDKGVIAETGTHEELLAKNGVYANLIAREQSHEV